MTIAQFQRHILAWYRHNRRDLPWRTSIRWRGDLPMFPKGLGAELTPYRVLVSEIMLQQTQIPRVLQKYPEFLRAFPTFRALARAPRAKLFSVWQGMGYWRRALYLQACALRIQKDFGGRVPSDLQTLRELPGIGPYTAGAITCFAYQNANAFVDTNIRRVYIKFFFPYTKNVSDADILPIAQSAVWLPNPREWHYALMDYGSMVLSKERTLNTQSAHYHKQTRFEGSTRFWRANIIRLLLTEGSLSQSKLSHYIKEKAQEEGYKIPSVPPILTALKKDGMICSSKRKIYSLN